MAEAESRVAAKETTAMRRTIKKLLAVAGILLAIALFGAWLAFSPVVPYRWEPEVEPATATISAPNREGLTTALRPLITQIAPGDSLWLGIHWQRPEGALDHYDPVAFGTRSREDLLPRATLSSMSFAIALPSGEVFQGRVKLPSELPRQGHEIHKHPGLFLELDRDGIALHWPVQVANRRNWRPTRWPWLDGAKLELDSLGVYSVAITGKIIREKAPEIDFSVGPARFEVTSNVKSQESLAARARFLLRTRWLRWDFFQGANAFVADDPDGNRHFQFYGRRHLPFYGRDEENYSRWAAHLVIRPDGALVSGHSGIQGTCVAAGTLVRTPIGPSPIEDIRLGDEVIGYDVEAKRTLTAKVQGTRYAISNEVFVLQDALRLTGEHPVWANGKWTPADRLQTGDVLITEDGQPRRLTSIQRDFGATVVVDLDVDYPNTFFADGLLVHNKKVEWTPERDDPWYVLPGAPSP